MRSSRLVFHPAVFWNGFRSEMVFSASIELDRMFGKYFNQFGYQSTKKAIALICTYFYLRRLFEIKFDERSRF